VFRAVSLFSAEGVVKFVVNRREDCSDEREAIQPELLTANKIPAVGRQLKPLTLSSVVVQRPSADL